MSCCFDSSLSAWSMKSSQGSVNPASQPFAARGLVHFIRRSLGHIGIFGGRVFSAIRIARVDIEYSQNCSNQILATSIAWIGHVPMLIFLRGLTAKMRLAEPPRPYTMIPFSTLHSSFTTPNTLNVTWRSFSNLSRLVKMLLKG